MMQKIIFLCALGLLSLAPSTHAAVLRPNIVLIFVDDMGYGDLGCYGNKRNKTPNIDRLAAEGQRWTSFYSSGAVCVPSRTGLMTGRHPHLFVGKRDLPKTRDKLMAAMLKKQGYATAILGKWHLAGYPRDFTKSPMHPLECGFDYHFGTPGSNDVPAPPGKRQTRSLFDACDKFTFKVPLIRGRKLIEVPTDQELLTKRYTEEAVKWINTQAMAQQDASANPPKPFFLYLAHNMPHAPVFASENFRGKSEGGRYGDTIEEIDWSVGQVMKAIKEAKVDEKTLIVFTSDNGPWSMFGPHGGTAKPLRGEKGTSWEGGYRVPGIFRWPGKIKPGTVDGLAANLDLYATFATLSGGEQPGELPGFISKDISGVLLRGAASPRKKWFYSSGSIAFRSGNYKIHLSSKKRSSNPDTRAREPITKHDPPLLYDLSTDVGEKKNIAADHPEIVARLLKEMNTFRERKNSTTAKPTKELTLVEKVVGVYQGKSGSNTQRVEFLENGKVKRYLNDYHKAGEGRWKIAGKEVHINLNGVSFWRIEVTGDLTGIARVRGGKREEAPKDKQVTLKKRQPTQGDKIIGTYEYTQLLRVGERKRNGTSRIVFREKGVFEAYQDFPSPEGEFHIKGKGNWKTVGKEVHLIKNSDNIEVARVNPNGSLTLVAHINDGKRKDVPKEEQRTFKKIK